MADPVLIDALISGSGEDWPHIHMLGDDLCRVVWVGHGIEGIALLPEGQCHGVPRELLACRDCPD